jgi:hypothetical protein
MEKYGIPNLQTVFETYSMGQIGLLTHVSWLKFKDMERDNKDSSRDSPARGKKRFLNKNNAEAAALIMQGLCS